MNKSDSNCVFCKIIAGQIPSSKVYEDADCIAILDIAPFEKGHILVLPKVHAPVLAELPPAVLKRVILVVQKLGAHLVQALPCDGYNLLQNNGACAGQTVAHVHFHLIPRFNNKPMHWNQGSYASDAERADFQKRLSC